MAEPILIFEIDEESGEVVYRRPQLSDTRYMLGPKDEVMEIMADFLAQQDFGEPNPTSPHSPSPKDVD